MGSDLASTTERCLLEELGGNHISSIFVSPGSISGDNIRHIPIKSLEIAGLNTISGAIQVNKKLNQLDEQNIELVLVDWRYVQFLKKYLISLDVPWCIIDRGPPAITGLIGGNLLEEILMLIQKRLWKSAWKFADKSASHGFVVSEMHKKIVKGIANEIPISTIPAGSYSGLNTSESKDPTNKIKLGYIGRIDKKRGVMEILKLSSALRKLGVDHQISMAGEGDCAHKIEKIARDNENISLIGKMKTKDIGDFLSKQHIGIMPMPDNPVWRLASPLKLAEYLAHGLGIIGPSHPGNTLPDSGPWDLLSANTDWVESCANKISLLQGDDWLEIRKSALSASTKLHWKEIGKKLCLELSQISSLGHSLD